MAVCLQYQSVYVRREKRISAVKVQLVAACALLGVLGVRVWTKLQSTDVGYQLAKERQRSVALDMERRELELQRSLLLRPDALARAAHVKAGLVDRVDGQTIHISY